MRKFLLLVIVLLAFVLRFYNLSSNPPSLNWDETSNAYNAYSILQTGRDEFGNLLPIVNRSFDDFKPPLYMYLNVGSVWLLGLNPFAARLPSALLGSLTIPIFYLFCLKIFENIKSREKIALLAAFFLAIAPWHIMFSRIALEANIALFTSLCAFTCFLYSFSKKSLLIVSSLLGVLSLYAYHSQRIFLPIMGLVILIIYKKKLLDFGLKYIFLAASIVVLLSFPLLFSSQGNGLFKRLEMSSADLIAKSTEKSANLIISQQERDPNFLKYVYNRRIVIASAYFQNYIKHFNPSYLFLEGDSNIRHHLNNSGLLYLIFIPFLGLGLYKLKDLKSKNRNLLLAWLLASPIPAAFATPAPHAIRSYTMIVPIIALSGYGFIFMYQKFAKIKIIFTITLAAIISFSLYLFILHYFHSYPIYSANEWQYGYRDAALYTDSQKENYKSIYVHNNLEQAYIFWLFNLKVNPLLYQQSGSDRNFGKFEFVRQINKNSFLAVFKADDFPQNYQVEKTIYYPNGKEAIKIGHP